MRIDASVRGTAVASSGAYFAVGAPQNTLVGANPTLAANSATLASTFATWIGSCAINRGAFTPFVYEVDDSTPLQQWPLANSWFIDSVPTPAGMVVQNNPSSANENYLCLIHKARQHLWTCLDQQQGGWGAVSPAWGAYEMVPYRLDGSGWWDSATTGFAGGRASGASHLTGLTLRAEYEAGVIPHALVVGIPRDINMSEGNAGAHVAPATFSDGTGSSSMIPMGTHFQLDPTLNLDTQSFVTPSTKIFFKAMQDYGFYIGESTTAGSGQMVVYLEHYLQGTNADGTLWCPDASLNIGFRSHLRVIAPPSAVAYDSFASNFVLNQPHH